MMIWLGWFLSSILLGTINFAESAITSLSVARLKGLKALDGGPYWKAAHRWLRHPEEYLTILLFFNNLFDVIFNAALLSGLTRWLGVSTLRDVVVWLGGGFINLTVLTVYPKILGRQFARGMVGAWILRALSFLIAPLYPVLRFFFWVVARLSGSARAGALGKEVSLSLEELRELIDAARSPGVSGSSFRGAQAGSLDLEHRAMDMAANYLRLREVTLGQIMTPKEKVATIDWDQFESSPQGSPQRQRLEFSMMTDGHSRTVALRAGMPVGYIHAKDLLLSLASAQQGQGPLYQGSLEAKLRPILALHSHQTLLETLPLLLREKPLAYVISGLDWIGIVSSEDLLEEITGEIVDEFESRKKTPRSKLPGARTVKTAASDAKGIN